MGLIRNMAFFLGVFCVLAVVPSYAAWEGPTEIISGSWGSGAAQFGIEYGDTHDLFPDFFDVSGDGDVVISDGVNGRFKLFRQSGQLLNNIIPPLENPRDWAIRPKFVDSNIVIITNKYFFFSLTGSLIASVDTPGGVSFWDTLIDKLYIQLKSGNQWLSYSPTGQLIKTYSEKPLELGKEKSERLGEGKFKITITYPDKVFGLSADRTFIKYFRDKGNYIYGINPGGVWRFSQCGKLIETVLMPAAQIQETPRLSGGENLVFVEGEYGVPVVAPNGDVYTWKRTPDKYSILKWTWVDDPNVPTGPDAPSGLAVTASTSGLYLTWTASPQYPGCVTGYEVVRATSAGGVTSTIATVEKGVLKYSDTTASAGTTYYYKVRALAGSEYSSYSSVASGKK